MYENLLTYLIVSCFLVAFDYRKNEFPCHIAEYIETLFVDRYHLEIAPSFYAPLQYLILKFVAYDRLNLFLHLFLIFLLLIKQFVLIGIVFYIGRAHV